MSGAESIRSVVFFQESPCHAHFREEQRVPKSEILQHFNFGLVLESAILASSDAITLAVVLLCESVVFAFSVEGTHLFVTFVGANPVIIQSNCLFL
jgi:hypothetical protein